MSLFVGGELCIFHIQKKRKDTRQDVDMGKDIHIADIDINVHKDV